jgi:long-chain acyl-CoA synthetase
MREKLGNFNSSMFNKALESKRASFKKTGTIRSRFWDTLVFGKVRKLLGGRLRIIGCGGAQVSTEIVEFL